MEKPHVELRVHGVSMEDDEPIAILEDRTTDRQLLVPVGPFEASAIIIELEGISPPRPLTHDLLAEFFEEGGFSMEQAEIFAGDDGGARARLSYRKGLRKFEKEVRPSDAIALALRLGAPLRAESALLDRRLGGEEGWRRPRILTLDGWKNKAMRA